MNFSSGSGLLPGLYLAQYLDNTMVDLTCGCVNTDNLVVNMLEFGVKNEKAWDPEAQCTSSVSANFGKVLENLWLRDL